MTTSLVDTEAKARITRLERSFLGSIGAMLSYLRRTPFLGSACVVLLLVGGVRGQGSSLDPSSYSNVEEFVPKHLSFNMEIDFEQSVVSGTVTHTMEALTNDMTTVYMDVWDGLTVKSAEFAVDEASRSSCPTNLTVVSFAITTPNPNIGNALAVELPCSVPSGTIFYLKFAYETTPDTTALSWLTPEQTAGKQLPYMYSLCQMNFCRDFAPMMDTPSQKITYNATVVAPSQFVVRMSANTTSTEMYNETHTISTFDAAIKIPSYLIAIVVGDLVESDLDERVSIISEPTYIDSAVEEFSELPEILDIAEAYLTPYAWGRYSIVIMPPSFPWGGMEHPLVTFASHTLITGDKSKVETAIHELTHSWFGNNVGCQNWDNFWINEGLNTFMERKTLEQLRGVDFAKIEYYNGNITLLGDIEYYGYDNSYSSLFPDIGDDDPENSFSYLPYEKGSQFIYYLETLIGEDSMKDMLQLYMVTFQQMAITQQVLRTFYEEFVYDNFDNETATGILIATDWDTWVLEPGLAPYPLDFSTSQLVQAQDLAEDYIALGGSESPMNYTDYFDFIASQQLAFVQTLAVTESESVVTADLLAYIDSDLNITHATNPDVKTEWYLLGIDKGYDAILEPCYQWMGEQGRNAYVRPTFEALVAADMCEMAEAWFSDYKLFYNSYVVGNVERALEGCTTSSDPTPTPTPVEDADEDETSGNTQWSLSIMAFSFSLISLFFAS